MAKQPTESRRPVKWWIGLAFAVGFGAVATMGYIAYQRLEGLRSLASEVSGPNVFLNDLERLQDSWTKSDHSLRTYVMTWEGRDLTYYVEHSLNYEALKDSFLKESKSFREKFHDQIEEMEQEQGRKEAFTIESMIDSLVGIMDARRQSQVEIVQSTDNFEVNYLLKQVKTMDSLPQGKAYTELVDQLQKADGRRYLKPAQVAKTKNDSAVWDNPEERLQDLLSLDTEYTDVRQYYRQDFPQYLEMYRLMDRLQADYKRIWNKGSSRVRDNAKEGNVMIGALAALILAVFGVFLARIFSDLERNAQLEQELTQQKNLAEKLAKAKEDFLANMSHEMRTPLGAVIGYADQLAKTPMSQVQQRMLEPIQHSADLLLNLINDILDFSKMESGNFTLEKIAFQPKSVVEEVISMFALRAQSHGIRLESAIDPQVPDWVMGDRVRLKQMLLNLVSNGVKFTPKGSVGIKVVPEDAHKHEISFAVTDTGIGIRQEKLDRIFDEFMQADDSISRKYGGTGLGLAITKKLAEIQGGRISLESKVGKGTTVSFVLPLPRTEGNSEAPAPSEPTTLHPGLVGKQVLVADDMLVNRELVTWLLAEWGMEITAVPNGLEAYNRAKSQAFDLYLLDLNMPEMDGVMVAQKLRRELNIAAPVIALTATSSPAKIQQVKTQGFDEVLLKPFKERQLYDQLVSAFGLSTPTSHNAPTTDEMEGFTRLSEMSGGDQGMVLHMLKQYMDSSSPQLTKLKEEIDTQNWLQVAIAAHRLVPSARILELSALVNIAKQIEQAADSQTQLEQIPRWFTQLEKEMKMAHQKVSQAIQNIEQNQ